MSWFGHRDRKPGLVLSFFYQLLRAGTIPKHVAFIMDGNRRFAKQHNISRKEGHLSGFDKLTEVLQWCYELGIVEVTVYAFSIENFKRSEDEKTVLLGIFHEKLNKLLEEREQLMKHDVCIRFIGDITMFGKDIQSVMAKVVHLTKNNKSSILNVAMAYTSRDEIANAIKEVSIGVQKGVIYESDIDEEVLEKCFYTNKSNSLDLLIRTSGEIRLSDFLLWQSSFTTLCFVERLWPEFTVWDFLFCIFKYQIGYGTMENSNEFNQLKTHRSQMDTDLKSAYSKLKLTNREPIEKLVNKQTFQRENRIRTFLEMVERNRKKLFFPEELLHDNNDENVT